VRLTSDKKSANCIADDVGKFSKTSLLVRDLTQGYLIDKLEQEHYYRTPIYYGTVIFHRFMLKKNAAIAGGTHI